MTGKSQPARQWLTLSYATPDSETGKPGNPMRSAPQPDLFATEADAQPVLEPAGLRYAPEVIGVQDEARIVGGLAALPFAPFDFHGYKGNRRVAAFGLRYDYDRRVVEDAQPMPPFILALRDAAADVAGLPPQRFVQALATEYAPGAGIGWHRDRPHFGEVVGVSLLTPCTLRFRRRQGPTWERRAQPLAPRSAYLLSGPARSVWEHSIAPLDTLRYSVTFRTLA
jgi:alkylated DNA repair dioxygenase AlkB